MTTEIKLDQVFVISENVVVREIADELVIVPIAAGVGDMENELYALNETGKAILNRLDGKNTLNQIAQDLGMIYQASLDEIKSDVLGMINELFKRNMLEKLS